MPSGYWESVQCEANVEVENPVSVNVRLSGGGDNWGLVEVFHDGEWGTVCDDFAALNFVDVLCSQLGMHNGEFLARNEFRQGSGAIWLDDVQCTGVELTIENCTHKQWGKNDCGHSEDVGVVCNVKNCDRSPEIENGKLVTESSTSHGSMSRVVCNQGYRVYQNLTNGGVRCLPNGQWEYVKCEINVAVENRTDTGDVRLTGGGRNWGLVEVFHQGEWGTVCSQNVDLNFVDILCSQLGMHNGIFLANDEFHKGKGRIWLVDVQCTGVEMSIFNCTHMSWGSHGCSHSEDVGVACNTKDCGLPPLIENGKPDIWRSTYGSKARVICDKGFLVYQDFQYIRCLAHGEWEKVQCGMNVAVEESLNKVRLIGGSDYWGRVEVNHDGEWGTVCDDNVDYKFADVLCGQLGMRNGALLKYGEFEQGTGKIWLDDVHCSGSEVTILHCSHDNWGSHNCDHSEDVGVVCNATSIDCKLPHAIRNGRLLTNGSTTYGSIARVICNPGYRVYQTLTNGGVRCLPHGGWESVECEKNNATIENALTDVKKIPEK
ncbi:scavenger receptor cysteine-rich type 1 protein M130-like isoform X2 [Dreissena polymorpha]|uniref:scavenger receptor cysteine-rich type 1 protein M130-like isoform X2 n=1 Tax=Dreissena polymorpha TaxID=45954 RepID=UPI00226449AA|nr:scavenger receptor cysteine-rich type 1 protein M130-like isoform X2 [Dreissena polymorpha]